MVKRTEKSRTAAVPAVKQYITLISGEKLYIWRRRNNLSQSKMAVRLNVAVEALHQIERGNLDAPAGPWNNFKVFTLGEQMTIARRRRGETLSATAKRMGVSKQAIIDWEADRYGTEEAARKLIP